jgi:8-oxo-dGTP pyrophosphatase MutT (NUDIX family)
MRREILEEVGLDIPEDNLKLVNVTHRINSDRVVIDFYYEVLAYSGTPINAEPHKSE